MITMTQDTVLAEALFASDLQRSQHPTAELIRAAVTTTVHRLGAQGCAALVAQEFGEHPDSAVGRMRWARNVIHQAYPQHFFEEVGVSASTFAEVGVSEPR